MSKTDTDSNYSYFLLYGSSWPQSQHTFLTLVIYSTALRAYVPSSASWSTVLRTYIPSFRQMNSGSSQHPVIKIRTCAILQHKKTLAKVTARGCKQHYVIKICSCAKANKMADTCTNKLRREFCSFAKMLVDPSAACMTITIRDNDGMQVTMVYAKH